MDKYQEYIFERFGIEDSFIFTECHPKESDSGDKATTHGTFDKAADTFHIRQNADITKTKYILAFPATYDGYKPFDRIFVRKNTKWQEVPCTGGKYEILADFNDRMDAIKFVFTHNIATEYILKITYTEADKEKYYQKVAQDKEKSLENAANIKVSVGADLANIYFQPCCEEYDRTEITLFIPKDYETVGGPYGPVQKPVGWTLFKKCRVATDDFFLSVQGLAYGTYSFVLKQFDKNGALLLETNHITFKILEPDFPETGTVNVI